MYLLMEEGTVPFMRTDADGAGGEHAVTNRYKFEHNLQTTVSDPVFDAGQISASHETEKPHVDHVFVQR